MVSVALPLVGPAYTLRSTPLDTQECINLYPEIDETTQGKAPGMLINRPGLKPFSTLSGLGGVRALYTAANGTPYAIFANGLYELASDGAATLRGSMATGGPYQMADNGLGLAVVDGSQGYFMPFSTNVLGIISDPDFFGTKGVAYLDGYLIFHDDTQFQVSALLDGTNYDGLDFASAEGSPDTIVSILVDHRELWVFGKRSTEIFFNSGNASFPLERIQGAYLEQGCAAHGSADKMDNTVYWLGENEDGHGVVWDAAGYQPQRISTHAVETAISRMPDISDAIAYTYQQAGHSFYVLTFPQGNQTWVWDAATRIWHRRSFYETLGFHSRELPGCHTFAFGKHLVGDWTSGGIYQLDLDTYTDNGAPMVRDRILPYVANKQTLNFIRHNRARLDGEFGVGLEDGSDPQLSLRISDDGGRTWGNERFRSPGKQGAYRTRVEWYRLGQSVTRAYWLRTSDPIRTAWYSLVVDLDEGDK